MPVYEIDEPGGQHDFAMQFVEGSSLAERLKDGPFVVGEAARLVERIARAIQYMHEHSVIHRDLKPANILLADGKEPKVTDFGLAKQMDATSSFPSRVT